MQSPWEALAEHGERVPEQVTATGSDGVLAGRVVWPTLTTVCQPMQAMASAVVDTLAERIADPAGPPISRQLPVQVVLRQSCGCDRPCGGACCSWSRIRGEPRAG